MSSATAWDRGYEAAPHNAAEIPSSVTAYAVPPSPGGGKARRKEICMAKEKPAYRNNLEDILEFTEGCRLLTLARQLA